MSVVQELLTSNQAYASRFEGGDLQAAPKRCVAVLTCMDARLLPDRILGLEVGDANIIRNAGGRASPDALRSLVISYKLLGAQEFLVIHHTDCGMLGLDEEHVRQEVQRETGSPTDQFDLLAFNDLDESVREDVEIIRDSPLIPDRIAVSGFVYDVQTGQLREVT